MKMVCTFHRQSDSGSCISEPEHDASTYVSVTEIQRATIGISVLSNRHEDSNMINIHERKGIQCTP